MSIYCFRKTKTIEQISECRGCGFRRRCRAYQLWLEPELPFVFRPGGFMNSVFNIQNGISNTLDSLFPSEYRHLRARAMQLLPKERNANSGIVRLKMYELLIQIQ